jgi:hypothetical protein
MIPKIIFNDTFEILSEFYTEACIRFLGINLPQLYLKVNKFLIFSEENHEARGRKVLAQET